MKENKVSFIDKSGARSHVALGPELYRAAEDANMTVRQFINHTYPTTVDSKHDTFVQMCASAGLVFKQNKELGVNSTPLKHILHGPVNHEAGSVVRDTNPVQSRILFPSAILEYIEGEMAIDRTSVISAFDQATALITTVTSPKVEQPVISYAGKDGPEDTRSQGISQLTRPASMLSITASEQTKKIPTFSVGMEVSNEALEATTLDLVGMALKRQREVEAYALASESLLAMINGDADNGPQAALASVTAQSFDATIATAGTLTHKAWVLWLYSNLLQRRIDWVFTDINGALAIENRTGRPTVTGDDPNSPRIDTIFNIAYPNLVQNVKLFIVPADWGWAANTIMGIQSNSAIHKYVNSSAEYSAMEDFALRKGKGLRFDFGQLYARLFDDAFSVMTLTV